MDKSLVLLSIGALCLVVGTFLKGDKAWFVSVAGACMMVIGFAVLINT